MEKLFVEKARNWALHIEKNKKVVEFMRNMKKYVVRSSENEVEFYTKRSALIHYRQLIEEIRQNTSFKLIYCEKNNYYIYEEKATKNRYSVELLTLR